MALMVGFDYFGDEGEIQTLQDSLFTSRLINEKR